MAEERTSTGDGAALERDEGRAGLDRPRDRSGSTHAADPELDRGLDGELDRELDRELRQLRRENRRLRREYARARRQQHRRTAVGLAAVGLAALAGALAVPTQRTVLLALAGTGLFAAVLAWTLTPERFLAASVGERIHAAHAATLAALGAELGLQDDRIYVPAGTEPARLFVPQRPDFEPPEEPDGLLLVPEDPAGRGLAVVPAGAPLYEEFLRTVDGEPAAEPVALAVQLADAAVETFELAGAAGVAADRDGEAVAVRVDEPVYGDVDAIDHPLASLVATGLAAELDRPVSVRLADAERADALFEFRLLEE